MQLPGAADDPGDSMPEDASPQGYPTEGATPLCGKMVLSYEKNLAGARYRGAWLRFEGCAECRPSQSSCDARETLRHQRSPRWKQQCISWSFQDMWSTGSDGIM